MVLLVALGYPRRRRTPRKKLGVGVVVHDETCREESVKIAQEAGFERFR